jgi:hypothetical protein
VPDVSGSSGGPVKRQDEVAVRTLAQLVEEMRIDFRALKGIADPGSRGSP